MDRRGRRPHAVRECEHLGARAELEVPAHEGFHVAGIIDAREKITNQESDIGIASTLEGRVE